MRIFGSLSVVVASLVFTASANAVLIGGVEFADGAVSFADSVYSYSPGTDVGAGWDDASKALGIPDYVGSSGTAASLGDGGELILEFTDNSLTTSGDATDDLWIFEIGAAVETFSVYISTDALSWIALGAVSGQPTGVNIDGVAGVVAGTLYSFVKLVDDDTSNQTGSPYGEADIDAVGAISSGAPVERDPVPAPVALGFICFGLAGMGLGARRRRQA